MKTSTLPQVTILEKTSEWGPQTACRLADNGEHPTVPPEARCPAAAPRLCDTQAITKSKGRSPSGRPAFSRIPAEAILDRRLEPDALKLLAYRCGKIDFTLHVKDVKRRLNMSKDAFYKGISQLQATDILRRKQTSEGRGRFSRAKEELNIRKLTMESADVVILQERIIASVPSAQLAVYLFLKTRPPQVPTFVREVRERFGWSASTIERRLTWLIHNGLARVEEHRRESGQFTGTRYFAVSVDDSLIGTWSVRAEPPVRGAPDRKTPDTVMSDAADPDTAAPDTIAPVTYKGSSSHKRRPSTNASPSTKPDYFGGAEELTDGDGSEAEEGLDLLDDRGATSWLSQIEQTSPARASDWWSAWPDEEGMAHSFEWLNDEKICSDILKETKGKLDPRLLVGGGLLGYRSLVVATAAIADGDLITAHELCVWYISERFGMGDKRLISWAWLGMTLFGKIYEGIDLEEALWARDIPF